MTTYSSFVDRADRVKILHRCIARPPWTFTAYACDVASNINSAVEFDTFLNHALDRCLVGDISFVQFYLSLKTGISNKCFSLLQLCM